ncbi:Alpha/Beta hydrolase protein [Entophlyctis helioformis]|nr:Alpha/Beta hydrolase protein [Entophlyctis helioformis]
MSVNRHAGQPASRAHARAGCPQDLACRGGHGDGAALSRWPGLPTSPTGNSPAARIEPRHAMDPTQPASFRHCFATLNGRKHHYVEEGRPESGGAARPLAVLVHGFPDLWYGWRYQIRPLVDAGFHVLVPTMIGYGQTESPAVTEADQAALVRYSYKSVANDLAALLDHASGVAGTSAVFLGHDWGGMVVWRVAMHLPERVRGLAVFCTPFQPPHGQYVPIEHIVKVMPHLGYQQTLAAFETGPMVAANIDVFVDAMFHSGASDEATKAGLKERLAKAEPAAIAGLLRMFASGPGMARPLSEQELAYYREQHRAGGSLVHALNWYRTRRINYDDELPFAGEADTAVSTSVAAEDGKSRKVWFKDLPIRFVGATGDPFLPMSMAKSMEANVPSAVISAVEATHWLLAENPAAVNAALLPFMAGLKAAWESEQASAAARL